MQRMTRRDMLRWAGLVAGATVAAACTPEMPVETAIKEVERVVEETVMVDGTPKVVEKVVKETVVVPKEEEPAEAAGFQGEIEMHAQAYTPSEVLGNPDPNAPQYTVMARLAEEWMDLHPGVTLTYIAPPPGDDWLETQIVGGVGPDIFMGRRLDWVDRGKAVPLNDYLNIPNPYTPDDTAPWAEQFLPPFATAFRSPKGLYCAVPMNLVSTGVFCNVDMFKEAGIDLETEVVPELGSAQDWQRFMEWHQTLQDAGFIPFGPGFFGVGWFWRVAADQLNWFWTETIDVLNYHDDLPMEFQEGVVSQEEVNHAYWCRDWVPFDQPEMRDIFRIVKEWSQYFPVGWTGEDQGGTNDLFANGRLAMKWDGSWAVGSIQADDRREFEFSSFWLPPITKATSEFAKEPPVLPLGVGGYGGVSYALNPKTVAKDCVDECVDFLMYITTPENCAAVVNEVPGFIPANRASKALPEIQNLFVGETRMIGESSGHYVCNFGDYFGAPFSKWADISTRETTLFWLDEQTLDETVDNLKREVETIARDLIRGYAVQYADSGAWDLTQWECEPEV